VKQIALVALLAGFLLVTFPAAAADINVCGTLRTLRLPTPTNNEGEATVGDKLWRLSGTPGPNNISPQATVGSNVCLTGELVVSQTVPDLLIRWSLVPDTGQSPMPVGTTAPGVSAPASTLPSTVATSPQPADSLPLALAAALVVAAMAVLLLARMLTGRQRDSGG